VGQDALVIHHPDLEPLVVIILYLEVLPLLVAVAVDLTLIQVVPTAAQVAAVHIPGEEGPELSDRVMQVVTVLV